MRSRGAEGTPDGIEEPKEEDQGSCPPAWAFHSDPEVTGQMRVGSNGGERMSSAGAGWSLASWPLELSALTEGRTGSGWSEGKNGWTETLALMSDLGLGSGQGL